MNRIVWLICTYLQVSFKLQKVCVLPGNKMQCLHCHQTFFKLHPSRLQGVIEKRALGCQKMCISIFKEEVLVLSKLVKGQDMREPPHTWIGDWCWQPSGRDVSLCIWIQEWLVTLTPSRVESLQKQAYTIIGGQKQMQYSWAIPACSQIVITYPEHRSMKLE